MSNTLDFIDQNQKAEITVFKERWRQVESPLKSFQNYTNGKKLHVAGR